MKPKEGLAYYMRELDIGSIIEVADTSTTPRFWAIKTSDKRPDHGVMGCIIIGAEYPHDGYPPGEMKWIPEDSFVCPVDVDIYSENKCVYRTFRESNRDE